METTPEADKKNVRIAAAIFLFVCIPTSIWAQMYVAARIFVPQDPVATANNMLANEFMYRASLVVNFIGVILFPFANYMLYRIFRRVDKQFALLMIAPLISQMAVGFLLEVLNFAALLTIKLDPRPGFDVTQQQEAGYFLLRLQRAGMSCDKFFFGLSIIPWGILVWRSNFIPRAFGILLIVSGTGYVLDSLTGILFDRSIVVIIRPWLRLTFVGYILTMLWLLIKGVRGNSVVAN